MKSLTQPIALNPSLLPIVAKVHRAIVDLENLPKSGDSESLHRLVRQKALEISQLNTNDENIEPIITRVIAEIEGLGPLKPYMLDPNVTEIVVNGPTQIYVEVEGQFQRTTDRFLSTTSMRNCIDRLISSAGRKVDESQPMVDARLACGARLNAIIAPVALDGPYLTIRKFSPSAITVKQMLAHHAITYEALAFLQDCIEKRCNIVCAGGTGSGKTTWLNTLCEFIHENERVVTIEDTAELHLNKKHLVRLESRPKLGNGLQPITIRDLLRNALRMRPDRILIGECRGAEAMDMLQAMNTGHDGCMTTLHANSARDALSRMETMVMMADLDIPLQAVRAQIASAIDFIIETRRQVNGRRYICTITEVCGMQGSVISTQDIFHSIETSNSRKQIPILRATGIIPTTMQPRINQCPTTGSTLTN